MGIGKRIEAAMIAARKKPVDIARHFKISESAVSQWFSKDTGPKATRLVDLARFLNTTVEALMRENAPEPTQSSFLPLPPTSPAPIKAEQEETSTETGPPIPVWASAAAGDGDGSMILTSEPIDWIKRTERTARVKDPFAFHIVGDSMLERLAPGDQVIVSTALPLLPMTDCVFIHTASDGMIYALVKRLLRANGDAWKVRQLNPHRDFELNRRRWSKVYRIAEIRPRM
jgi:phage repressor protein C with HTH and peptisase S24 domain